MLFFCQELFYVFFTTINSIHPHLRHIRQIMLSSFLQMRKLKHRLSNMSKITQLGSRRIHKKLIKMINKRKQVRVQCRRRGRNKSSPCIVYIYLSVYLSLYPSIYQSKIQYFQLFSAQVIYSARLLEEEVERVFCTSCLFQPSFSVTLVKNIFAFKYNTLFFIVFNWKMLIAFVSGR